MGDLLWPGDHRAGDHFSAHDVVDAMLRMERAWLDACIRAGIAPTSATDDLRGLVSDADLDDLARAAEGGGNPVIPLLALVRERLAGRNADAAHWLHRGLTSQDVLDTALVLCARRAGTTVLEHLDGQVRALAELAQRHRSTVMAGRTLTQHAVPVTFGLKAAHWLQGVLDARADLDVAHAALPAQVGGAAGTLAAAVELVRLTGTGSRRTPAAGAATADEGTGSPAAVEQALALAQDTAGALDLRWSVPWHTARAPLTRYADALVRATDAWGRIANDVLLLARPELGELSEPAVAGRGGSSTMPQKANPVLSVLIRRTALTTPGLAAQLHLAAAENVDERPDGAWHTEWVTLAILVRRTVAAADQTVELLEGLHVDTGRMARLVEGSGSALLAEQRSIADLVASTDEEPAFDPGGYLGATDRLIDEVLERAREETR